MSHWHWHVVWRHRVVAIVVISWVHHGDCRLLRNLSMLMWVAWLLANADVNLCWLALSHFFGREFLLLDNGGLLDYLLGHLGGLLGGGGRPCK